MSTARSSDLRAFRDFADAKLANGGSEMTLEEALGLWDIENSSESEQAETITALTEALVDMRAGETGLPITDFLADIRRKYNLLDSV